MPGFTTPDPLSERHYNENPYAYCGLDPVNRIDPLGLDWFYFKTSNGGRWYQWFDGMTEDTHPNGFYIGETRFRYGGVTVSFKYDGIECFGDASGQLHNVSELPEITVRPSSSYMTYGFAASGYGGNDGNYYDDSDGGGGSVDNTNQALNHYFNGSGEAVGLGDNTMIALLVNSEFTTRHNRIISGKTTSKNGAFSVNMTNQVFHVGRTNVNYSIDCKSGYCSVTYNLFVNDGFWDVDFIDEAVLGGWFGFKNFQPDGLGPNLERLGGTPYPYIPQTITFTFPNPGY